MHQSKSLRRADGCQECGSNNWQSIEMVYQQSVRKTGRGYVSHSIFAEKIAPPEPRSIAKTPVFVGIGFFIGSIVVLPELFQSPTNSAYILPGMFNPVFYVPSIVIGLVAAIAEGAAAVRYNSNVWANEYLDWTDCMVCRKCGNVYQASNARHVQ